jgi:hypothetical protein
MKPLMDHSGQFFHAGGGAISNTFSALFMPCTSNMGPLWAVTVVKSNRSYLQRIQANLAAHHFRDTPKVQR